MGFDTRISEALHFKVVLPDVSLSCSRATSTAFCRRIAGISPTEMKVLLFGTSGNPPTGSDGHSGIVEYFVSLSKSIKLFHVAGCKVPGNTASLVRLFGPRGPEHTRSYFFRARDGSARCGRRSPMEGVVVSLSTWAIEVVPRDALHDVTSTALPSLCRAYSEVILSVCCGVCSTGSIATSHRESPFCEIRGSLAQRILLPLLRYPDDDFIRYI